MDVDGVTGEKFTPTAIVESSPGHYHYYYEHPGGVVPCSASVVAPGIDIRGDGGVVILPPSVHFDKQDKPDGRYTWIVGPKERGLCAAACLDFGEDKDSSANGGAGQRLRCWIKKCDHHIRCGIASCAVSHRRLGISVLAADRGLQRAEQPPTAW